MTLILHHFETVDSTMDEARLLLQTDFDKHINSGVVSDVQLKGRGRQARTWVSPVGNLYLTLMLEPVDLKLLTQYSMMWGLILKDSIEQMTSRPENLNCKWPNDLLLDEKKIAGLLIETYSHEGKEAMLVGIGVNLFSAPEGTVFPASSLKDKLIKDANPTSVAQVIYENYKRLHFCWHVRGFDFIRHQWQAAAWRLGETINIRQNGQSVVGIFQQVDAQGGILIKDEKGTQHRLLAGDVFKETENVTRY